MVTRPWPTMLRGFPCTISPTCTYPRVRSLVGARSSGRPDLPSRRVQRTGLWRGTKCIFRMQRCIPVMGTGIILPLSCRRARSLHAHVLCLSAAHDPSAGETVLSRWAAHHPDVSSNCNALQNTNRRKPSRPL